MLPLSITTTTNRLPLAAAVATTKNDRRNLQWHDQIQLISSTTLITNLPQSQINIFQTARKRKRPLPRAEIPKITTTTVEEKEHHHHPRTNQTPNATTTTRTTEVFPGETTVRAVRQKQPAISNHNQETDCRIFLLPRRVSRSEPSQPMTMLQRRPQRIPIVRHPVLEDVVAATDVDEEVALLMVTEEDEEKNGMAHHGVVHHGVDEEVEVGEVADGLCPRRVILPDNPSRIRTTMRAAVIMRKAISRRKIEPYWLRMGDKLIQNWIRITPRRRGWKWLAARRRTCCHHMLWWRNYTMGTWRRTNRRRKGRIRTRVSERSSLATGMITENFYPDSLRTIQLEKDFPKSAGMHLVPLPIRVP